jgi:hypothetical protein
MHHPFKISDPIRSAYFRLALMYEAFQIVAADLSIGVR